MKVKLIILLFFSVLSIKSSVMAASPSDTLKITKQGILNDFTNHLYFYKTNVELTPNQLIESVNVHSFYKIYPEKTINYGKSNSNYWMVFTIKNTTDENLTYYLQLNNPSLKFTTLYRKSSSHFYKIGSAGNKIPFHQRVYNSNDIVFPLKLEKGRSYTYACYLEGKSRLQIMPIITDEITFKENEHKQYLILLVIIVFMAINFIANITLFFILKNKINFIYAIYLVGLLLNILTTEGYDFQYLYPNIPLFARISIYMATGVSTISLAYLVVPFLELTVENSKFLKLLITLRRLGIISTFTSLIISSIFQNNDSLLEVVFYSHIIIFYIILFILFLIGVERSLQNYKPAWFYLMADVYIAYSGSELALYLLGIDNPISIHSYPTNLEIGIVIDTLLIFIGIIYQYNIMAKKRNDIMQLKLLEQQRQTMDHIVTSQEDERKRLAQDLHDDLGGTLSTLMLHVSNLNNKKTIDEETNLHYQKSISLSKKAIDDLKTISYNLLPKEFSEKGLYEILRNRIDELNNLSKIRFVLITDGDDKILTNNISITLYRITSELINNTLKHSQATKVTIQLLLSEIEVMLIVEDNGTGIIIDDKKVSSGLKNINSRIEFLNGKINIDTSKKGTTIIIEAPITQSIS
jgi:signal transduction histidine kinase